MFKRVWAKYIPDCVLVLARFFTEQETCRAQPKIRNNRFLPRVCTKKKNKTKPLKVLAVWQCVSVSGLAYLTPGTRLNPSTTRANVSFPTQSTSVRTTEYQEALTVQVQWDLAQFPAFLKWKSQSKITVNAPRWRLSLIRSQIGKCAHL